MNGPFQQLPGPKNFRALRANRKLENTKLPDYQSHESHTVSSGFTDLSEERLLVGQLVLQFVVDIVQRGGLSLGT